MCAFSSVFLYIITTTASLFPTSNVPHIDPISKCSQKNIYFKVVTRPEMISVKTLREHLFIQCLELKMIKTSEYMTELIYMKTLLGLCVCFLLYLCAYQVPYNRLPVQTEFISALSEERYMNSRAGMEPKDIFLRYSIMYT